MIDEDIRARLKYDLSQQPRFLKQLYPTTLVDLLRAALDAHRVALAIDQDNPDLLLYVLAEESHDSQLIFHSNTAQVLSSLAEAVNEDNDWSSNPENEALQCYQEALGLFQRCLNLQEFKFKGAREYIGQEEISTAIQGGEDRSPKNATVSETSEEEVWAAVEEPITKDNLLETTIAQVDTLTAMCTIESSHSSLAWMEEYFQSTLQTYVNSKYCFSYLYLFRSGESIPGSQDSGHLPSLIYNVFY